MSRVGFKHRLEYALTRGIESALGTLSTGAAERAGELLGRFAGGTLRIRRDVVEENLRNAFPGAEEAWVQRVARECYAHLGREAMTMLRLSALERDAVRDRVDIVPEDWSAFERALAERHGVVLVTGHYGNWEVAAAAVASRGVQIAAIVKQQSNPLMSARFESARRALGVATIDMADAPREVPRILRAGGAIGIVGDQDARRGGVWVPFFGRPASTYRGPAYFALRLNAALFPAVARRRPEGGYLLSGQRLDATRRGTLEEDVTRVTADLAASLEREIRVDPGQYFWFHKRWKTAPPEEHLPSEAGTKTHDDREP